MLSELKSNFAVTRTPVGIVDGNLRFIWANDAAIATQALIFAEDGLHETLSRSERILITAKLNEHTPAECMPRSGIYDGLKLVFSPCEFSDGKLTLALCFLIDIGFTPKKNFEQTEKDFISRRFVPVLRDEAANAITNLELLRCDISGGLDERLERYLRNATEATYSVFRDIEHIRLFTSISEEELKIENHDIIAFAENLFNAAKEILPDADITLNIRNETDDPIRICSYDENLVTCALLGMLANAYKAADGENIRVTVTAGEKETSFSFSNDGKYIPPHVLNHVTEPFFSYNTGIGDKPGVGLGLSIARAVAERHGGGILIQSTRKTGTTVMLKLPYVYRADMPKSMRQDRDDYIFDRFSPIYVELFGL